MDNYTPTAPGVKAPSASKPGTGAGNVPFAPGVMSGNYGTGDAPLARQMPAGPPPTQGSPGTPAPPGQPPEAGGMPGMPSVPMVSPWPQIYVTMLDSWMQGIMKSISKPLIGGQY